MSTRKLQLFVLPALVLALALASCGGGGGESEKEKVASTIEAAATGTDPAVCKETQTLEFMEQTTGKSGRAAEGECEKEAEEETAQPESVTVSGVEVNGSRATADAAFEGGTFDKQTLELALVDEGGEWKLDEFTGFARFDMPAFFAVLSERLEEGDSLPPHMVSCILEGLEGLPKAEIESVVVENNIKRFVELARGCE